MPNKITGTPYPLSKRLHAAVRHVDDALLQVERAISDIKHYPNMPDADALDKLKRLSHALESMANRMEKIEHEVL